MINIFVKKRLSLEGREEEGTGSSGRLDSVIVIIKDPFVCELSSFLSRRVLDRLVILG